MTIQNTPFPASQSDYWNTVCIPLSRGKHAVIDSDDFDLLAQHKWHYSHNGYAVRWSKSDGALKYVLMHREITGATEGEEVDHKDKIHEGLDNRKSNLRVCTRSQNSMNKLPKSGESSEYKGVSWCKRRKRWQVRIKLNSVQKWLGILRE